MPDPKREPDELKPRGPTEEEIAEILRRVSGEAGSEPLAMPETAPARPPAPGGPAAPEPEPEPEPEERIQDHLDLLMGVPVTIRIELGRKRMTIEEVLRLGRGSVVALDRFAGDLVGVYVNDRLVARGEVVISNNNFAVRVAEILLPRDRP